MKLCRNGIAIAGKLLDLSPMKTHQPNHSRLDPAVPRGTVPSADGNPQRGSSRPTRRRSRDPQSAIRPRARRESPPRSPSPATAVTDAGNPQPEPARRIGAVWTNWRTRRSSANGWKTSFPSGASEFLDPVTRRHFVKIMSASFLLAGLGATGCRRPTENIYPFAKMPENYAHGVPQFFATAMPSRRGAVPLVVKSSDGRPTKVEGNPDHPDSNGGTDPFAQASVLSLYDPDRAQRYARNGSVTTKAAALDALADLAGTFGDGDGVAFLMEQSSSPSRARMQRMVSEKYPKARWFVYEPVDLDAARYAASLAYGKSVAPYYNLDKAEKILALDCDFIGSEENAAVNIRRFAQGRRMAGKDGAMSRLYAVESLFTLTGMNADHRLRVPPSLMVAVVARLALNILPSGDWDAKLKELSALAAAYDDWIVPCAKDLKASGEKSLVMAGLSFAGGGANAGSGDE